MSYKLVKGKYILEISYGFPFDSNKFDPQNGYPLVRIRDIFSKETEVKYNGEIVEEALISHGDVLIGMDGDFNISKWRGKQALLNQRVCRVQGRENVLLDEFMLYALEMPLKITNDLMYATTVKHLGAKDLNNLLLPLPSIREQEIISLFLTEKVTTIKKLIEAKMLLLLNLENIKKTIITEAVTKGLDSNVKMKDSGIEWVGEIPEHWELSKVGYLGRLQNGISKSSEEFGFGTPFVSYGDVYKNEVLPKEASGLVNATEEDKKLYSVKYGDIFFTRTSETIEEIGIASTCLETIDDATFAGFLIRFRPTTNRLSTRFARFYFRSALGKRYFVKEMNLVTRASLSQGLLRNFTVLLPKLEEQEEIASYLEHKTAAIEESVVLIKKQIEKLKEYRQALIYEAVTGKIDVRDMNLIK